MLANYSKSKIAKYLNWLILPAWALGGTMVGFAIAAKLLELIVAMGVDLKSANENVIQLGAQALSYIMAVIIVIGLPYLFFKKKINLELLGLKGKMKWRYPFIALGWFGVYYLLSLFLMLVMVIIKPDFDISAEQDVGFESLSSAMDYIIAFVALVVAAPIAEEILFRGFLFGSLKKTYKFWISMLLTSLTFGVAHGAWNVGVDTFALSLVLCYLRYHYDSLYPAIFLHMIKNGMAYLLLFVIRPF